MKKLLIVPVMLSLLATSAQAGTTYHVYKKGSTSTCDIDTKGPSQYNRGSKYVLVATSSTRSGAKKAGASFGCTSF